MVRTQSQYNVSPPAAMPSDMPSTWDTQGGRVLPEEAIARLERDGVVCLRNVVDAALVAELRRTADEAFAKPGPQWVDVAAPGDTKRFFYEYNLWKRFDPVRQVIFEGEVPRLAAALMRTRALVLYYSNTFVKEGGADDKVTPWHEDASYFRLVGRNVVNFNIPFDDMPLATTLQFKQGSHARGEAAYIGPTFKRGEEPGDWLGHQAEMPDQAELDRTYRTLHWPLKAGDATVFWQRTLHAAPGNTLPTRRHSMAIVYVGDGVTYDQSPGVLDLPDHDATLPHGAPLTDSTLFPRII
ncbi:MAG: phytanoyl-CoA dioxygenase family protein [Alphaproteobacteria bacterium]